MGSLAWSHLFPAHLNEVTFLFAGFAGLVVARPCFRSSVSTTTSTICLVLTSLDTLYWFCRLIPCVGLVYFNYTFHCEMIYTFSSLMEGFMTLRCACDVSFELATVIALSKVRFAPSSNSFSLIFLNLCQRPFEHQSSRLYLGTNNPEREFEALCWAALRIHRVIKLFDEICIWRILGFATCWLPREKSW